MIFETLISPLELAGRIDKAGWVLFDCRFNLADPAAGLRLYHEGHLPGARYAHLDHDLSSPITALTGRHPLPDPQRLAAMLADRGVGSSTQVVVYDDAAGAFAGRLWWLLRWLGHRSVAVLDGGIKHWLREGLALDAKEPPAAERMGFTAAADRRLWLDVGEVRQGLDQKSIVLVDARTPERYRGEQEPIDPVAGHVPGAVNRPFQRNLDADGRFLPPPELRAQFRQLIGDTEPLHVVHMCGSGVTACHNLLAMEVAGLKGSRLYAGSWSEWIRDPSRPVATGAEQ